MNVFDGQVLEEDPSVNRLVRLATVQRQEDAKPLSPFIITGRFNFAVEICRIKSAAQEHGNRSLLEQD